MAKVPTLHPCPGCGLLIQKVRGGPFGLAHHQCTEVRHDVRNEVHAQVEAILMQDSVQPGEVKGVLLKMLLLRAVNDEASSTEIGGLLEKLGDLDQAPTGGGEGLTGGGSILAQLAGG